MSEARRSVEPWPYCRSDELRALITPALMAELAKFAIGLDERGLGFGPDIAKVFIRRIVACVNACAGIPTEALEAGRIRAVLDAARAWGDENSEHPQSPGEAALGRALCALGRLP